MLRLNIRKMVPVIFIAFHISGNTCAKESPIRTFKEPTGQKILCMDISDNGEYLVTGSANSTIVWDIESGKILFEFDQLEFVSSVDISPDGKKVVSGGIPYTAAIWDIQTGTILHKLRSPTPTENPYNIGEIQHVVFTADSQKLLTEDVGSFVVWDAYDGKIIQDLRNNRSFLPEKFDATNAKDEIIIRSTNGEIQFWNIKTVETVRRFSGTHYIISPNKKYILYNSSPTYTLLDFENNIELSNKEYNNFGYAQVSSLSPNGKYLLCAGYNEKYSSNPRCIVDLRQNKRIYSYELNVNDENAPLTSDKEIMFFPNDSNRYATINGNTVNLWDISDLTSSVKEAEALGR